MYIHMTASAVSAYKHLRAGYCERQCASMTFTQQSAATVLSS